MGQHAFHWRRAPKLEMTGRTSENPASMNAPPGRLKALTNSLHMSGTGKLVAGQPDSTWPPQWQLVWVAS